ncbi:efflux RND transporter permease subunit [Roseimaritima sediminicola]|uniref:efflux RND transporter permease subunit n=1 Tax=Roseimaritima sediminicola TaxID=2662066 RepID=UPI00129833FB|nr:MMPL family transporter [Roseimaritima sediminicola]
MLVVIFFFLPWATRSARLSLQNTENNVKDWLPDEFRETAELAWFGEYFAGERFVLATWPGATAEDQRLSLFASKLRAESAGAVPAKIPPHWEAARETAEELALMLPADHHKNWGGRNEKWLTSEDGRWYFVTPDGKLFRWEGEANVVQFLVSGAKRLFRGPQVEGTFVAAFGGQSEDGSANPYYNNPTLLTASLFRTVQTGPDVAEMLAVEGGPLWPVDLTDPELKPIVARRRAVERLTGTLFAPAVPHDFSWTGEAFYEAAESHVADRSRDEMIERFEAAVAAVVQDRFDGRRQALREADSRRQADAWYAVFDRTEVEPPPRQTAVMVTLTQLGQRNLPHVVGRGVMGAPRGRLLALAEQSGLEAAQVPSMAPPPFNQIEAIGSSGRPPLRLGGPPVDNVTIDEEGTITLSRLIGYSVLLGFGLSYLCFRSLKITIMVFAVGGMSAVFGLAMVGWTGTAVDAILLSMPSLVYVLGLSSAIHVVNYYRDEVKAGGVAGAPGRALRHAVVPCTLAAVTTAIGLISLYTSNITPIRKFGLFSAIGVLGTIGILFVYLPAALETFVPKLASREKDSRADSDDGGFLGRLWHAIGQWIVRRHRFVAITCFIGLIASTAGLLKIQTTVQLLKMFSSDSRIISDYAWLEDHFGKLVPMELVVRVPPEAGDDRPAANAGAAAQTDLVAQDGTAAKDGTADQDASQRTVPLNMLERVEAVSHIQTVVEQAFGERGMGVVGRAMSTATFLPDLPPPSNSDHSPTRYRYNQELTAAQKELQQSDYYRVENSGAFEGSDLFRISLRVSALADVDYGRFIFQLRKAVEPVLEAYRSDQAVSRQLEDGSHSKRLVAVLGRSQPQPLGREPILQEADTEQADEQTHQQIDQRAIYETALADLLRNHRRTRILWHDPTSGALQGKSRAEGWGKNLARADMVVLLRDHPDYDVEFIKQHASTVLDLRDVPFDRVSPTIVDGIPVAENAGPLEVVYTGVIPVVYKAQRTLLYSLVESIAWAFVLIAIVMIILLNPGRNPLQWIYPGNLVYGVAAGMVAMIPNIFPVATVFGLMCHMGIKIDIGTMMVASVAMGVAVDDTIHFLAWFRHNLDSGIGRLQAITATYRRVGPAMTQTTIVGGLGLFVFALSSFTPTQRFGMLMLVMLSAALVGDLIFLPALLASPLGRVFKPRRAKPAAKAAAAANDQPAGGLTNDSEAVPTAEGARNGHPHAPHAALRNDPAHRPKDSSATR